MIGTRLEQFESGRNSWQIDKSATVWVYVIFILMGFVSLSAWAARSSADERREEKIIATLNGEPIKFSDVKDKVAFQVYRLEGSIYLLLKKEVEKMVDQKLLAAEASRRALTVSELIQKEVREKIEPVTDSHVDAFLAQHSKNLNEGGASRERIRAFLFQKALSDRQAAYLSVLRQSADFKLQLQPPIRPRIRVDIDGEPWRGNPDAPVTLIHFANFTHPLSRKSAGMIEKIMDTHPNQIKWVHRNFFAINDERALAAAQMAEAACVQGKFWEFHDKLFDLEGEVGLNDIVEIGEAIGLKLGRSQEIANGGDFLPEVKKDISAASQAGVTTVPVLFVNGLYFSPTFPYENLARMVDDELKGRGNLTDKK